MKTKMIKRAVWQGRLNNLSVERQIPPYITAEMDFSLLPTDIKFNVNLSQGSRFKMMTGDPLKDRYKFKLTLEVSKIPRRKK